MAEAKSYVLFGGDVALWLEDDIIMLKTTALSGDAVELTTDQAKRLSRILLELATAPSEQK
jgi:hypothetical protein